MGSENKRRESRKEGGEERERRRKFREYEIRR